MAWMETERTALVQTLHSSDPEAPTLCEGWNVSRLLAHLILREQQPWKIAGDLMRRDPPGSEQSLGRLAAEAGTDAGYRGMIDRFAGGPAVWSPMRWGGDAANLIEYVVHHEDVRRGSGDAPARRLPDGQEREMRRRLPLMARMGYRRCPVGVVLALPTGEQTRVRSGDQEVVLSGEVTELALHSLGRRQAARIEISGDPEIVELFDRFAVR